MNPDARSVFSCSTSALESLLTRAGPAATTNQAFRQYNARIRQNITPNGQTNTLETPFKASSSGQHWLLCGHNQILLYCFVSFSLAKNKTGLKVHSHRARERAKIFFAVYRLFIVRSLIFFAFTSTFSWCEYPLRARFYRFRFSNTFVIMYPILHWNKRKCIKILLIYFLQYLVSCSYYYVTLLGHDILTALTPSDCSAHVHMIQNIQNDVTLKRLQNNQ